MKHGNFKKYLIAAVGLSFASMLFINNAAASIIVDPKGHDVAQMEQDKMECRSLANSIEFDLASEHQGHSVLRGAAIAGGAAAIAGGGGEARRRSMGVGALAGGVQRNKAKRVDASAKDVKVKEAQRNCLIGRGYNPIS